MQIQEASKGVANGIKDVTRKSFRMRRLVPPPESIANSGPVIGLQNVYILQVVLFAVTFFCDNKLITRAYRLLLSLKRLYNDLFKQPLPLYAVLSFIKAFRYYCLQFFENLKPISHKQVFPRENCWKSFRESVIRNILSKKFCHCRDSSFSFRYLYF